MAESLAVAVRNATLEKQPRAHANGLSAFELEELQKRLPSLTEVRNEADLARKMMSEPPPTDCYGMEETGESLGILHPSIAYHVMLPKTYVFSYFCHEDDVPEDLRVICLWALQHKVRAVVEGSDKQLRRILAMPEGKVLPDARVVMESQSRVKAIAHLLSPQINIPEQALPHVEALLRIDESQGSDSRPNDAFLRNPNQYRNLYTVYGTILARTKTRNERAKLVLERILNDIDKVGERPKAMFIQVRLYLSRVLRRMGELEEAKKHETYLITWFRKNPHKTPEKYLRDWFETETTADPVLEGLGGMNWFKRKNHPYHKASCATSAVNIKRAKDLKATAPDVAKCIEDWRLYSTSGHDDVSTSHALGLRHDSNRGKDLILIKKVEYVPQGGRDVLDRFRVVAAGVFRIRDVLRDIERLLSYSEGTGDALIKEMREEFENGPGRGGTTYPFFTFLISDDVRIENHLGAGGIGQARLRSFDYDPEWRKLLNRGKKWTVEPLCLRSGAKDVERDYTPLNPQKDESTTKAAIAQSESGGQTTSGQNTPSRKVDTAGPAAALPRLRGMFK
ncbi:hypothetical protein AAF712_008827 [Marasmius tenuissimus]|uniref:Uncharacterized protein n=1 Tax=Marasmius tenuissimus TaxID=585030 RepID=A0ABR2ZVB0_9AGAR